MKNLKKYLVFAVLSLSSAVFAQNGLSKIQINNQKNLSQASAGDLMSQKSEALSVNPQLANASADYLVTAGDIYQLSFAAGTTPVSYSIQVDSTYAIKIANLATINGEGKTFLQLKKQVEDIVNRNYPMGGVQFLILSPSLFRVVVTGEVVETVEKQVWAMDRVSSLLEENLTGHASTRYVKVTHKNGNTQVCDLFKAKRDGDLSQNPYLRPDDKVEILRFNRKVKIDGAVERPGEYELNDGENFISLLNVYAGGLADRADTSKIELLRVNKINNVSGLKLYPEAAVVEKDMEICDKDEIYIYSYSELKQVVFFEGAIDLTRDEEIDVNAGVSQRKAINFNQDESYDYFIRKNVNLFSSKADLKNAYIIRDNQIIPLNLEKIIYDKEYKSNVTVMNYDILRIPFTQYFVTVAGAVKNPGRYPYIPDRSWEYYVGLAGGFERSKNSFKKISIVDRNNNKFDKKKMIEPETTITAETNSFTYYFNTYAPIVTTALSVVSTTLTVIAVVNNNKQNAGN